LSSEQRRIEFICIFEKFFNLAVTLAFVHWLYHLSLPRFPWRCSS